MAKQPVELRDRFRIFAETSSEEMGPLLAQLTRMGLENIGYELITDVVRFNKNGPRIAHETTGDEHAREWLVDHPTFRAIDLVRHFADSGRSDGSAYTAIRNLVASEEIVKTSPGHYQRADVKAIAPPAATEVTNSKKRGQVPAYETHNLDLILRFIKPRKRITVKEVQDFLVGEGRNKKSASPIISKLAATKVIKKIEPGVYEVVKGGPTGVNPKEKDRLRKQAERAAAKAAKKAANLNGAEAHGS